MNHQEAKAILEGAALFGDYCEYSHIAALERWHYWKKINTLTATATAISVYRNLKRMELP